MKKYKVNKWYNMFYITKKYMMNGKTHYDIVDKYGERVYGISNKKLTELLERLT